MDEVAGGSRGSFGWNSSVRTRRIGWTGAALALGVSWCQAVTGDAQVAIAGGDVRPRVSVVETRRGKDSAHITLPATIQAMREATIHARISGYVRRWTADIGDRVSRGQLLVEIDTPELDRELEQSRAQLAQIRAQLDLARSTARRYRGLVAEDAVSPQEVDEKNAAVAAREADLAAATARVRQLESMDGFQRVRAPFSGAITARNVEVGSLVSAGSLSTAPWLYRMVQDDVMRVQVSVPQHQMSAAVPGLEAELLVRELGGKPLTAKVVRRSAAFDPTTRTVATELRVDNPEHRLVAGMYGQVRFTVKYREPPIVVPVNALLVGGDGTHVAVVGPTDVVQIRKVQLGRDLGKEVEILEGLADRERVVNNPRDGLVDGLRVTPVLAPPPPDKGKEAAKDARTGGTSK